MPVRVAIDTDTLRAVNKRLAEIDPDLRKQVGKDIKEAVRPTAARIKARIPQQPPLSGMRHNGRTVNVSAYATPGGGRGSIARMEVFGRGQYRAGLKIADLAGTRGRYVRGERGRKFIDNLDRRYPLSAGGKGGRFAWQNFMKERPFLIEEVVDIINGYVKRFNKKGLR